MGIKFSRKSVTTSKDGETTPRRRKGFLGAASVLATVGAVALGGLVAAPAQAVPGEAFEIFYGQNCSGGSTASRNYDGASHQTPQEQWINDTFNSTRFGTAGYGQLIRNNAASIYIRGSVAVYRANGTSVTFIGSGDGECHNFPASLRNQNVAFSL